jgi:SAM-dependent methyltransferase
MLHGSGLRAQGSDKVDADEQPCTARREPCTASRLRCPQCHGPLVANPAEYRCPACPRRYPIVYGIPDFRLSPDPYIPFEDEYRKAAVLAEQAQRGSFEDLVRFYWEITPDVPRPAVARYVRSALSGEQRGAACLEAIDASTGARWAGHCCLEVGCGTGGFLLAARERFDEVVGIDIALRWLVIARKRLGAGGPLLVCCSADHLPFATGTFDGVVGLHVLEHTQNPAMVVSETARVLKPQGLYYFLTPNRFSLGPEPCVRVWGVGFLPPSLASDYVRLVKGVPYRNIRLLSPFALRRLFGGAGLRHWTITPPRIAACEVETLSGPARRLIPIYHALRELPLVSSLLRLFGPLLQVVGRK